MINKVEKGREMCGGIPDEAGNEMRNERDLWVRGKQDLSYWGTKCERKRIAEWKIAREKRWQYMF